MDSSTNDQAPSDASTEVSADCVDGATNKGNSSGFSPIALENPDAMSAEGVADMGVESEMDANSNQGLSCHTVFYIIVVAFLVTVLLIVQPEYGLVCAFLFSPLLPLIRWHRHNLEETTLDSVLRNFGHGFVGGFLFLFIQSWCFVGIWYIWINCDGGYFNCFAIPFFVASFFAFALPEESMKYLIATSPSCDYLPLAGAQPSKATTMYMVSLSLGFSTMQNLVWTGVVYGGTKDVASLLLFAFLFLLFSAPLHCLSGYLIGLYVAHDNQVAHSAEARYSEDGCCVRFLRATWVSILARGILPLLIATSIMVGSLAGFLLLAIFLLLVEFAILLWWTLRIQALLPDDYLRRVGHLQMFGYGVLPGSPEDEQPVEMI